MIRKAIIIVLLVLLLATLLLIHIERKYIIVFDMDSFSFFTIRGSVYAKYFYPPQGMLRFYVTKGGTRADFLIDYRLLMVALAAYPAYVSVNKSHLWWRKRHRKQQGMCLKCGYNLTGNISGICPECGEKISSDRATE